MVVMLKTLIGIFFNTIDANKIDSACAQSLN